jgi:NAD+ kinase
MKRVGLVPHREREQALALAREAATWFRARDVEVRLPEPEAVAAGLPECGCAPEAFAAGLELVISFGGDGTMLHTFQLVYPHPVALLGVNAGQLGYLTALEPSEFDAALPRLLAGDYSVSERSVVEVALEPGPESRSQRAGPWFALNEAVLEKVSSGHLIRLEVCVNGSPFTTYAADGVIISTPTGSTAYSFSARGPIVSPALQCVLLTPVSPHMLFDRTLILGPEEHVDFVVNDRGLVGLTVDGRDVGDFGVGDRFACRAATAPARIVTLAPRDFHQILKAKFALPDR